MRIGRSEKRLAIFIVIAFLMTPVLSVVQGGLSQSAGGLHHESANGDLRVPSYSHISYVHVPYSLNSTSNNLSGKVYNGTVTVMVTFAFSNQTRLNSLLSNISNPSNPQYHKYLTRSEFTAEFSPSAADYQTAVDYFYGFKDTSVTTFQDRVSLMVRAPGNVMGSIFNTTIQTSSLSPSTYYATSSPSLPSFMASNVAMVTGLSNQVLKMNLNFQSHPVQKLQDGKVISNSVGYPSPQNLSGIQNIYGSDLQVAYDEQSLLNVTYPTNEVIATILWTGYNASGTPVGPFNPSDIYAYYNATLPSYEPHPKVFGVPVNGAPQPGISSTYDITGASGENTLDLEMAGSTAPGASIYNVYGPNSSFTSIDAAFAYILNPNSTFSNLNNVSVISNSWGNSDTNNTAWYGYLQEAQARGITVLASSGDSGDSSSSSKYTGSQVQFPSTMAYNNFGITAVGGTNLSLSNSLHIDNQTVWYDKSSPSGIVGSTGGISTVISEPSWQLNTEANNVINGAGRGVPDISAIANNTFIYETLNGGSNSGLYLLIAGGTSVASPLTAGMVAEIDAIMSHYNQSRLGFLNPLIYQIANMQFASFSSTSTTGFEPTGSYNSTLPLAAFYNVEYGGNSVYNARFGYSLATGWGSIDAYNFTMYSLLVNRSGDHYALNGIENVFNLSALNVTSYLYNISTGTYSTPNTQFNASIQQNFFVANALGAPLYWIQNVIYIYGSPQSGWTMNYTGWVVFPFYGLYPQQTVYEYNYPLGKTVSLPHQFMVKSWLSNLSRLNGQTVNFEVNSHVLQLSVPGASFIIGSNNYSYQLQGKNYLNGPYPNNPIPGGLSPQFGLVGGPSGGIGDFMYPTAGNMSSFILPQGGTLYIGAATSSFTTSVDQTGEQSSNLNWIKTGQNTWNLGISNGSSEQGILSYYPDVYNVTFQESGLPAGTEWWVNLTSGGTYHSTGNKITFNDGNGTYDYTLATANKSFAPSSQTGSFSINGAAVSKSVAFGPAKYNVTFTESGLPAGIEWWVNLTGPQSFNSTTDTIVLSEENGIYSYETSSSDSHYSGPSGSFTVSGANVSVTVPFNAILYNVTLAETGLPSGTQWYANTSNGLSNTSTDTSMNFSMQSGNYVFSVSNLSDYYTVNHTVSVSIGGNTVIHVVFQHWNYITGTLNPSDAALEINGKVVSTGSGTFNISVPDGHYSVYASASGYSVYYDNFTLSSGQSKNLTIDLQREAARIPLTNTEIEAASGALIAVVAITSVMISRWRKR